MVISKNSSLDLSVINALEDVGFNFIESWIYNKYNLQKLKPKSQKLLNLREANIKDLDYMIEFSKGAFATQRFHADKNISTEKAESLYVKWIKTSFESNNQKTLVYDHNNTPSAFMTYYLSDLTKDFNLHFAMWKMALLNPEIRGIGIGALFFDSLFDYHRKEGCDFVDSGLSLRNIASLNLHNKINFKTISSTTSLHLWV